MRENKFFLILLTAALPFFCQSNLLIAQTTTVTHSADKWCISGVKHKVILNEKDFSLSVLDGSVEWNFLPSDTNDLSLNAGTQNFSCRLSDAGQKEIALYQTGFKKGLKITLSQFHHAGENIDLMLQLFLCLEGSEEDLVCDILPNEKNAIIKRCNWPKGLQPEESDYTVVPAMQGMLLPRTWQYKVQLLANGLSYSRGLYMPWWGHLQGNSALLVLMELRMMEVVFFLTPQKDQPL